MGMRTTVGKAEALFAGLLVAVIGLATTTARGVEPSPGDKKPSSPTNQFSGGSSSGFAQAGASSNGNGNAKAEAIVGNGNPTTPSSTPSPGDDPRGGNRRVIAQSNQDQITTAADDDYSYVIKVHKNGAISMLVITFANLNVKRIQANSPDDLQKKDAAAFQAYQRYTAPPALPANPINANDLFKQLPVPLNK